jgi:Tetraspanin family
MHILRSKISSVIFVVVSGITFLYSFPLIGLLLAQSGYTIASITGIKAIVLPLVILSISLSVVQIAVMWLVYSNTKLTTMFLFIFNAIYLILVLITLIATAFIHYKSKHYKYISCTNNTILSEEISKLYIPYNTFGLTAFCPIKTLKNTTLKSIISNSTQHSVYEDSNGYYKIPIDSADPCHVSLYGNRTINKSLYNYLDRIERAYCCSGFCVKAPMYYFSDVTLGIPKSDCSGPLQSELNKYISNIAYACIGLLIVVMFITLWSLARLIKYKPPNIYPDSKSTITRDGEYIVKDQSNANSPPTQFEISIPKI